MTYVISQPCVDLKDRACVDECPVDCIYEGKRMLYIHPDECVDCGACEPVCPVEAIFYEDDTPEQWKDYYKANVEFFDDLGSPGGAAKMGEIDKDHPMIAALPAAGNRRALTPAASPPGSRTSPGTACSRCAERARAHPDGIVDLSIGTPVDPTPAVVQDALRAAADSPGYPLTIGRVETRQACVDWLARRHGVTGLGLDGVLPVIGSKELIASMPVHLGLGAGDLIVYPELAYPTYEVGAALAGARAVATDSLTSFGPETPALLWLNSPSNPTGRVLPAEHLRKVVDWCRERGTILVSDECYLECAWEADAAVGAAPLGRPAAPTRGSSRSTRSRSGPTWPATGARSSPATRRWSASCSPYARTSACRCPARSRPRWSPRSNDDEHVVEQHARYAARRAKLREALAAGRLPDRPLRGVALPLVDP